MANTRVQKEVADWIRTEYLPGVYGISFSHAHVALTSGGSHKMNVSDDGSVVAGIITSVSKTSSGSPGSGKVNYLYALLYFLTVAKSNEQAVVFTEPSMKSFFDSQQDKGLVGSNIHGLLCVLPDELAKQLAESRQNSSKELGT